MKLKKLALISATSLMLISTCIPALNATNATMQTVLAAKKKKIKKTKVKESKSKKRKNVEKEIFNQQKHDLYNGDVTYSGPKPNLKLEKILRKFATNTHDCDDDGYTIHFKAKRDTKAYYDKTDYEDYDENGDPVKPNQLGIINIKKGETLNLYNPNLQLSDEPFLGRNIFKNKVILVGTIDELGYNERYYYMDDFKVIK